MKKKVNSLTNNHPIISKKINKSLNLSIKEGSVASASHSFGLSYFSPFALALNATSTQVGILDAVINFSQGLVQLSGPKFIEKFKRKKVVLFAGTIEVLLLIPIILTAFLYYKGLTYSIWIFILLVGLFYISRAIIHPAWFSWIGSLAPENGRGKYFSKRNRLAGFSGIIALAIAGLILNYLTNLGKISSNEAKFTLIGFGIIFCLSMIFRTISLVMLSIQYEPTLKTKKKDYDSFWKFLKNSKNNPFGKFTLFRFFFSIAVGIAAPFWTVYLLRDLSLSYFWFMAITISTVLFQLAFFPLWGKISDKVGNIKVIKISVWSIFLIPFAWIASSAIPNPFLEKIWLLLVPQILSGIGWAGFNLCANNYVYDAISQAKRTHSVSYMNLLVGLGLFTGSIIGTLITWIGIPFMNTLLFIFFLSGVLRFLIISKGIKYLDEVRNVKKYSSEYIIKAFFPTRGIIKEIHNFEHLVDKVEHHI